MHIKYLKYLYIIYNITIIILFTIIYYYLSDKHFELNSLLIENNEITIIDYINLSITIQSTIGLPAIRAKTFLARLIITIQQLLLIIMVYSVFINLYDW